MDRSIIYTAEQGRSTDFLFGQRATMIALGKLAAAVLGTTGIVNGLACTPTSPAGLTVNVAAGEIYSLTSVDATAYGSLTADTTDQIVKQGLSMATSNLSCPAPTTSSFSINYLIEATYQDVDAVSLVLPFYNSANPSQPLSGQNNSGAPLPTQRQGKCVLTVKAGAAAPTGSQVTPTPDTGSIGLWVVTVANGQTTITNSNITQYGGAPFITATLPQLAAAYLNYAQLGVANQWTAGQAGKPVTQTFGATVTPNLALGNNFVIGVTANFALANPTNAVAGQSGVFECNQTGSGAFTISSFGNLYVGPSGTKPNLHAAVGGTDLIFYYVMSTGKILLTNAPAVA